ncbi:MAG: hypothetical protein E6729_00230 [Finegoldia magna]|nr:hypothetical protein [Finegoldia magna]
MNFNEIGLKDLVLDFDSNDLQDITIVQGDTKTRGFKVLVSTNNGEIIKASSNYEMRLYGVNSNYPDKSFFTRGTIDGDFYKVYISTDMASKSGKLQLQLALFEGTNALIQSRIKEVDVYRSIANGGNVGKDLVVDFGKLNNALEIAEKQQKKFEESLVRQEAVESKISEKHKEVVEIRDGLKDVLSTENARVEAEKKRVSAENTRASQEKTRQSNETTRQSNEKARQQKESTRTSNETQRQAEESTRKSEEQKRISAESSRSSEEAKRDNAEKIRVENENKRVSAEDVRLAAETRRFENEQLATANEQAREIGEQQRVEAEKLRQSQENTRKQSEDTRVSQESTRQTQEQSRVDAESKRATSETTRKESEQTRNTKETERQNAEQTRQSNEQTRVSQESSRVEAEKQREKAESDRAGKFAGWDKTMSGVIPTATSTVAGIVRIDVDGESTAISKKSFDESVNGLTEDYNGMLNALQNKAHINHTHAIQTIPLLETTLDNKANKTHKHTTSDITGLQIVLDSKLEQKDIITLKTQVDTNTENITEIDGKLELKASKTDLNNKADKSDLTLVKNISEGNSKSILGLTNELDNKANKTDVVTKTDLNKKSDVGHTHSISDVSNLQTTLNSKASTSHIHDISDINNLQTALNGKSSTSHGHSISDINNLQYTLNNKASASDLSSLQAKVNKNQIPRLKIGEDTSKVPNDSYYIETDEVELKKYLSEEKIIFIGDRDNVNHEDFENLIDLKGQKMTKKQDDYHVTNLVVNVNDSMVIFKETYNSLKAQGKDFSNHLIILGIQEEYYYPGILVYFDFIKKITKSRKIIHIFDPILKAKVTQESYDNDVGMMEMVSEPDYLISSVKLLRGGNILRYKDENGVIH